MKPDQKIRTGAFAAGLVLLCSGAAVYSWPAGLCIGGLVLIAGSVIGELRSK